LAAGQQTSDTATVQTFDEGSGVPAPGRLDVTAPAVRLRALTWGPDDGPIALFLNGFPDIAYAWRRVAPAVADAGWRVVVPFLRRYAPSSIPADGSYHVGGADG
jgi:pimeloyl-ACP methyl ester carboxylesterase